MARHTPKPVKGIERQFDVSDIKQGSNKPQRNTTTKGIGGWD